MSETSSRVEKEDNSNKKKLVHGKNFSSVKKHHRKLASYNGYGVVVILSGSYHAFCILCVLILCTQLKSLRKKKVHQYILFVLDSTSR